MLIVSCVEFIPLQLPTTVSFKCVLISINFSYQLVSFKCVLISINFSACFDVSSEWFDCTEPSRTSSSKTSTHLAFSALKWFEKVRGGSRGLNHSETVYRYPTHLVTTVKMRFEKVRYSRTTPNSRQRLLHTLLSLH